MHLIRYSKVSTLSDKVSWWAIERTYCICKLQPFFYTFDESIVRRGNSLVTPYYKIIECALSLQDFDWIFRLGFVLGTLVVRPLSWR